MDFFTRQDNARKHTGRLIALFGVAVIMIVLALNAAAFFILRGASSYHAARYSNPDFDSSAQQVWQRPEPYVGVTLITLGIIACGSFYKMAVLAHGGGAAVALSMGGRPIVPSSAAPAERRLQNVVEEMSIASGVPVPQIFVMDDEDGINAFAAGFSTSDAIVCVTRGCLTHLSRDELQGVIAHEFSHILNGDMRMNLRLMGVLNGILVIGLGGYILMRSLQFASWGRRRGDRDDSGQIVLGLFLAGIAMFIIGYVGVFFGRLIQAAVSRQREYLADASAVQFTRNPMGLAGALKKIGQFSMGSTVNNPHAMEAAHLFFASGVRGGLAGLLATHPPLVDRIRALDPTFDGNFVIGPGATEVLEEQSNASRGDALAGLLGGTMRASRAMPVQNLVQHAGAPAPHAIQAAANVIASIPAAITQAAREPFSARALTIALLLGDDPSVRTRQIEQLRATLDTPTIDEALKLGTMIAQLNEASRVPLTDLTQPALRQMSLAQLQTFAAAARAMIEADAQVTLFEYAIYRQIRRALSAADQSSMNQPIRYASITPVVDDVMTLLSAVAFHGKDSESAAAAFRAGIVRLQDDAPNQTAPSNFGLKNVDAALERLSQSSPGVKRRVIDALAHAAGADGVIQVEEAELLRAVCAALDVPMPVMG